MERNIRMSLLRTSSAVTWCRVAARALDLTPDSTRYAFRQFAEMTRATAAVICGAMLFPAFALAGEPYIGAAAGYSIAHFNNEDLVHEGTYYPLVSRVSGASYRVFAGYSFCPYVGLEGGWFDAAHLSGKVAGFPITSSQSFEGGPNTAHVHGVSLDVVGTLPVTDHLSGFARAGVLASRMTSNTWYPVLVVTENPPPPPVLFAFLPTLHRANLFEFAIGVQYKASSSWSFESEWQRVNMSDYRMGYLDTLEIAAVYTF
jgi:OmpA-like transmembrane domain